jgi:predicted RNA-binding protein YlxR (DUF448 family)
MLARVDNDEADSGPRHAAPERLCVATRTVKPVGELIRFVVGPDQAVVPDVKRKLPGRGVWVTATRAAVATAVTRGAFGRSFKRDVRVAGDLAERTELLLERSALDALAIAHKAGRVAVGFAKVEAALAGAPVAAMVHAADASPDGVRKLAAAARRRFGAEGAPVVDLFTAAQLDLAMGRANVIHAALLAGPETEGFLARCRSFERFRSREGGAKGAAARDG